ncbi:MAG: M24 family metallopeptidase [Syntrophorhabdaceae bacterium]|nr:M24 family metallopeptidase [Syntrophorhabdaceae bacterium]
MAFTHSERKRRKEALDNVMSRCGLDGLILIGDTNVGGNIYGDFRYFVDNRIITGRQVALVFSGSPPVLLVSTEIQRQAAERRSSITDVRVSEDMIGDTVIIIKERGLSSGRFGVSFEVLSVAWYEYLKKELSGAEWIETHSEILKERFKHSKEEAELLKKCAHLADGAYKAAMDTIKPGVTEYEIASAIEAYTRARGAEQNFTLVSCGRFSRGDQNTLSLPYSPSMRKVEPGDSVVMEITPCLEGYWTQLVRVVNVGMPNPELEVFHRVARDAIKVSLPLLKPGNTVNQIVESIDRYVKDCGYIPGPPYGHICSVDLIDERVSRKNKDPFTANTAVIIHPTVFTPDAKRSFFWGETYLITDDGYVRLNSASDELFTL